MNGSPQRYERSFVEFCKIFNKELLDLSLCGSSTLEKKVITSYGDVEVSKNHCLAPVGKQGFRISEYLQDLACYVGQQLSFDEASENLLKVGGIILSDKQVERICHHYGEILDESLYTDPIEPKD